MPKVFVSIGSNIERERHIPLALRELEKVFSKLMLSSVYETQPVGFEGENFYNIVAGFETEMSVNQVGKLLKAVETQYRSERVTEKFSPRTLDLDLLLYGDAVIEDGKIKVPRADITEYAFVLEPLAEIASSLTHPVIGETYGSLWAKFNKAGVRQTKVENPWVS
ncbi:MAG: 2-amino-4-hydroxy-6-hydroxymethyldihydropteridine diphosphokinase [Methylococcales bacterium]